jgi:precorrin-2 dehydrogenase/sirohydrochlorin ferrochelatase
MKDQMCCSMPKRAAKPMPLQKLFPMFLKLVGRRCLVVGAGTIAEGKIASLLEADAIVTVVAPKATKQVEAWAVEKEIDWHARSYEPSDLEGMFLVIASTSSTPLHEKIFEEATRRGILCNIVDVPDLCDFYYPAIVQRGALQIAISTTGQSPALAQRLRKELSEQFGPEYEAWLEHLGIEREKLHAAELDFEERKRQLHEQASADAFAAFLRSRQK